MAAMKTSASAQLDIFVKSIQHRNLQKALRTHDWDHFALNYNGASYRKWGYVPALELAYKKASKSPIDCSKVSASAAPVPELAFPT
ncbi:N-acetylmuramidase family protein, partial [Escherichia coli]|uniref:N-acetylmuramidase family protein n=1 Tax=Escherichia coli TaxID=562 RepID=UPI0021DF745B